MFLAKFLTALLLAINACFFLNIDICRAHPGIRVQITQKGLNYANELVLTKMYEELQNVKFPVLSKGGSTAYDLYNIKVHRAFRPSGRAVFVPGQGLSWTVGIKDYFLTGTIHIAQRVLWFTIRKTLLLTMYVRMVELKVTFTPTKAANGGLNLEATHCHSYVDVKVSSKNIILEIVLKLFRKKLNRIIANKLCESATKIINNNVARDLASFPVTHRIHHGYYFDYGFVSNPVFTSNYMQTNHKAAILDKYKNGQFPFDPPQLPQLYENKDMIYFIISEYVLNTWLYTAYRDNQLIEKFNSEKLKNDNEREFLQITCPHSFCIGSFLPEIAKKYPNEKMEIHFITYENPIVHLKPNHIQLNGSVKAEFFVAQANGTHAKMFTAELVLFSEVNTTISGLNLLLTVNNTTMLERPSVGPAKVKFVVKPKMGGSGVTIPKLLNVDRLRYTIVREKLVKEMEEIDCENSWPAFRESVYETNDIKSVLYAIIEFIVPDLPGQQIPFLLPSHALLLNPTIRIVQNAIIVASDLNIKAI